DFTGQTFTIRGNIFSVYQVQVSWYFHGVLWCWYRSLPWISKDSEGKFCKLALSNAVFGQLWKPEKVLE
ncbi:unnamed protein product, partial [Musa acuminata subsp. burmannicoides]